MKKIFFTAIGLLFLIPFFVHAQEPANSGERITSYNVNARLLLNGSLEVEEEITYDFGNNEKHGIYRYIPTIYKGRQGSPRQSFYLKSIKDKVGNNQPYELTNSRGVSFIKIGDENKLVQGVHTYRISYNLTNVISSEENGDRFRWDAVGTDWDIPIDQILVNIEIIETSDKIISNNCFFGLRESSDVCDYIIQDDIVRIPRASLSPHEGITLETIFEKDTFPAPSKIEKILWQTDWYYWLPLIGFLGFFLTWFEKGRDPKGHGTIVPIYDPPKDLTPFEASIILEDIIDRKALPAAIISLAIRGYIKIHRKEIKALFKKRTEYELELIKPIENTASIIDKRVADIFFSKGNLINLNNLGDSFAKLNHSLHTEAYNNVTEQGYYVVNPNISRIIFFAISISIFIIGILSANYFLVSSLGYICFALPGIVGFCFAFIMPVKTKSGAIKKEELLGLKMYIKAAEIDRIKFHNAPEKTPEKFEELLPYAIIFNLEKEWATEFKDIYKNPPSWYDGNIGTFSAFALIHDISGFTDITMQSAISASTSEAGGSFSGVGGGSGGGGGGSW